jgi:hypothetical protein
MEKNFNLDKRLRNSWNTCIHIFNCVSPLANTRSIINIIKHPIFTIKFIGAIIITIGILLLCLLTFLIEDWKIYKKWEKKDKEKTQQKLLKRSEDGPEETI